MYAQRKIPARIILVNVALVLAWVPLIFVGRSLITRVLAASPSDDLLLSARLAVIGTLTIITAVYLFAIMLVDKYLTQNLEEGSQRRLVRPVLIGALLLYVAIAVAAFTLP